MFIYTAKLRRGRVVFGICALVLSCLLLAGFAGMHSLWGAQSTAAPVSPKGVASNEERLGYIAQFGWSSTQEPIGIEEMKVPESFDESFTDYLATQEAQGFDLREYQGKRAKRYTYGLTNYPEGRQNVQIALLIYKNTVIAGEVFDGMSGEVLHGLARPS